MSAAVKKYNNISKNKKTTPHGSNGANSKKESESDNNSSKLIALLTKFWLLHSASVPNNAATSGNPCKGAAQRNMPNRNMPNENYRNIALWRFTKTEDIVADENGKSWYRCPFYNNGKGLYVIYKLGNHRLWTEQKKLQNTSREYNNAGGGHMPAGNTVSGSRL